MAVPDRTRLGLGALAVIAQNSGHDPAESPSEIQNALDDAMADVDELLAAKRIGVRTYETLSAALEHADDSLRRAWFTTSGAVAGQASVRGTR